MNITPYILGADGKFTEDWSFSAYLGFDAMGLKTTVVDEIDEIPSLKGNPSIIVVAGIDETLEYFRKNKIKEPSGLHIPETLIDYAQRDISIMSYTDFINSNIQPPYFVKAIKPMKVFPSGVVKTSTNKTLILGESNIPDDTIVLVGQVLDIIVEYRCYVLNNKVIGIHFYSGDFNYYIDTKIVNEAVSKYTDSPIAYSIDFGLTSDGNTVLIECNDAFSLGNYGLNHIDYARMLIRRWQQIIKNV